MTTQSRFVRTATMIAVLTLMFTAGTALAQVPWGACGNTTVCNQTGCTIVFQPQTTPAGAFPPITLLAGQCIVVATPGIATINSVISGGGFFYNVLPPPPVAPCNCPAGTWSVCCVTLGPAGCCCDICFDPNACRIVIRPSACAVAVCRP